MRRAARRASAFLFAALALALAALHAAAPRVLRAQAPRECSLSCPIGMECDAHGQCVASEHGVPEVQYGAELEQAPGAGAYEHDGFLARLTLGVAGGSIRERSEQPTLGAMGDGSQAFAIDVSGAGLMLGLDVGHAMGSSFAWHARLSQIALPSPRLRGDVNRGPGETGRTLVLLGPGLSYFGPYGLYAAAAVGVALTRRQGYDGDAGLGDPGLGFNFDVGLEAWIAEQFALGGVLRVFWSSTSGGSSEEERTQRALAFGVAASVTYQ